MDDFRQQQEVNAPTGFSGMKRKERTERLA
jgi:hypothetical protein